MNGGVSIVVPMFNESQTLRPLLDAISAQTLPPREVIFVDSGSTDDSVSIVENFTEVLGKKFSVHVLPNLGGLPGGNRNLGVRKAQCEWIAFLDAGIVPEINWLKNLMRCADSKNWKAIYGHCLFDAEEAFEKAVCAVSYGCGAVHPVLPASLFHRSVFEDVGWFRADLRAFEDVIWLRSLEKNLGPRHVCREAVVHYRHFPKNFTQLLLKWWNYEKSGVQSRAVPPLQIYACLLILAVLISLLIFFPIRTLGSLASLALVRGVISPALRSQNWLWWKCKISALPIAIVVCFVRDAAKILARSFYGLVPSRLLVKT